jgi:Fe-S cluster assembly iron-binding protein IscA
MALDEPKDGEVASQVNGVNVLIADEVKGYADNRTIDYVNEPYREGFTIDASEPAGC